MFTSHFPWWALLFLTWSLRLGCLGHTQQILDMHRKLQESPTKLLRDFCTKDFPRDALCSLNLLWLEEGAYVETCSGFQEVFSSTKKVPLPRRYYSVEVKCSLDFAKKLSLSFPQKEFQLFQFEALR